MIASILPGLRDLRAPLAAGCLWLLVGWLIWHDEIPSTAAQAHGPLKSLYELAGILGGSIWLAAVSFVAYLLGSLTAIRPPRNGGRLREIAGDVNLDGSGRSLAVRWRFLGSVLGYDNLRDSYVQLQILVGNKLRDPRNAVLSLQDHSGVLAPHVTLSDTDARTDCYVRAITYELRPLALQLQAKSRDLWDTFDRYDAEEGFRYAVAVPAAALVVTLSAASSLAWLLLLVLPFFLWLQALRLSTLAVLTLVQGVVLGLVDPPVFRRLDAAVEGAERQRATEHSSASENSAASGSA